MIIVKLGGSLYNSPLLKQWVTSLASVDGQTIVIVPGGGPFADQVRQACKDWPINDAAAHDMALLAMQQFAGVLAQMDERIKILSAIDSLQDDGQTHVWYPWQDASTQCNYPRNWHTTSDSLSMWLAKAVSATQLCLIKSASLDGLSTEQKMQPDIVDAYFMQASRGYSGETHFFHVSQLANFLRHINHE